MDIRKAIILIIVLLTGVRSPAQGVIRQVMDVPSGFCISEDEWKLYRMINEYRSQYELPAIPLSKSLSFVAATHVKDLFLYHKEESTCNFHSWSDKGPWKPFCYPADENKKNSVWDKPRELSKYNNKAFEIVYWENSDAIIDSVFNFWRSIDYFNSFLMNTGKWQGTRWNAIGIAIFHNYAVAWFGETPDPEGVPGICGRAVPQKADTASVPKGQKPKPGPVKPVPKPADPPPSKPGPQAQSGPAAPAPVKADSTKPADTGTFYVIVKSQVTQAVAEDLAASLRTKGNPGARVIISGDKVRVSLCEARDRAQATLLLREAKKTYKDAWLLKQ